MAASQSWSIRPAPSLSVLEVSKIQKFRYHWNFFHYWYIMRILGGISSRNSVVSGAEKSMMDFPSVRSGMTQSAIEPSGFTGGASDLISVTSYETTTSYSTCTARSARSAVSAVSALSHATTATATSIESSHHSQANSGKFIFLNKKN